MKSRTEIALSAPTIGWLTLFFAVPTLIVVVIAFRAVDSYGVLLPQWSGAAFRALWDPTYAVIVWRTARLSLVTTVVCLFLAIPCAYAIAQMPRERQRWAMALLIVPFWTNFLIRIYAWKVLLHPDGLVKALLVGVGLLSGEETLLYTEGAVLLVLVYTYLPFAILPVYAAAEKFDFTLIDAARDLGCTRLGAFVRIFVPGVRAGVITAVMVVLIPALGSYIIPEIVGGPSGEMIGNKIAQRVFVERNLPRASALSTVLVALILAPSLVSIVRRSRRRRGTGVRR